MITFQEEDWQTFWRDGQPLFPEHWRELALDQDDIPMDLDFERYKKLGEMGMLFILSARADGVMVGYVVMFLMVHFHYKSSGPMALADMYWLMPVHRKGMTGVRMFTEMEARLRARGVKRAHMGCKVHQDHQALFERLGWKFTDKTFSKLLKG